MSAGLFPPFFCFGEMKMFKYVKKVIKKFVDVNERDAKLNHKIMVLESDVWHLQNMCAYLMRQNLDEGTWNISDWSKIQLGDYTPVGYDLLKESGVLYGQRLNVAQRSFNLNEVNNENRI